MLFSGKPAFELSDPSGQGLSLVFVNEVASQYFRSPLTVRLTPNIKFTGTHLYTWVES